MAVVRFDSGSFAPAGSDDRRNVPAVVLRPGGVGQAEVTGVFVARDGRAIFTPVETGIIGGLEMQVEGVAAGTPIVAGPFQLLRTLQDGAAIRPGRPAGDR